MTSIYRMRLETSSQAVDTQNPTMEAALAEVSRLDGDKKLEIRLYSADGAVLYVLGGWNDCFVCELEQNGQNQIACRESAQNIEIRPIKHEAESYPSRLVISREDAKHAVERFFCTGSASKNLDWEKMQPKT